MGYRIILSALFMRTAESTWVGTYSGLNRFIEGRFHTELNNHGMPFDQINAIMEDTQGDIWVGSREGLIRQADAQAVFGPDQARGPEPQSCHLGAGGPFGPVVGGDVGRRPR